MKLKKFLLISSVFFTNILTADPLSVVTVEENNRIEDLADGTGVNEWRFMINSGKGVAYEAERLLQFDRSGKIAILVGKGYKGGNALWAGYLLVQKGYQVQAFLIAPEDQCPPVCQKIISLFQEAGGTLSSTLMEEPALIIDGLVGTGFKGAAKGLLAEIITWANGSNKPILAVDIPSGLNGNTGAVGTVAIHATHTIAISYPKIGFFLDQGSAHTGTLSVINIGLEENLLEQTLPEAYLISKEMAIPYLDSLCLTRQESFALLDEPLTLENCQRFVQEKQLTLVLTDPPMMIFQLDEKPLIVSPITQYYVDEETDEIIQE